MLAPVRPFLADRTAVAVAINITTSTLRSFRACECGLDFVRFFEGLDFISVSGTNPPPTAHEGDPAEQRRLDH